MTSQATVKQSIYFQKQFKGCLRSLMACCSFGKSVTQAVKSKQKQGSFIPVQATAVSRRQYKMRGSRVAIFGRPRHDSKLKRKLVVGHDGDSIVRYKLPSKKTKFAPPHSLRHAVEENKRPVKKH